MTQKRMKMKKTKSNAPEGSWLDHNGKRWMKVLIDVMADGGSRFVRQVSVTLGLHFDFGLGCYLIDAMLFLDEVEEIAPSLASEILRQYPSLKSIRNPVFLPTFNKVIR